MTASVSLGPSTSATCVAALDSVSSISSSRLQASAARIAASAASDELTNSLTICSTFLHTSTYGVCPACRRHITRCAARNAYATTARGDSSDNWVAVGNDTTIFDHPRFHTLLAALSLGQFLPQHSKALHCFLPNVIETSSPPLLTGFVLDCGEFVFNGVDVIHNLFDRPEEYKASS